MINVDVTPDPEIHIHRISRTGRGDDEEGWALNLCSSADKRRVASIAQRMGFEPEWHALDELVEDERRPAGADDDAADPGRTQGTRSALQTCSAR